MSQAANAPGAPRRRPELPRRRLLWSSVVVLVAIGLALPGGAASPPGSRPAGATSGTESLASTGAALYLALGDSVAAGVGASRPEEGGYAALLGGRLGRTAAGPLLRLNLAVPGETTMTLLEGGQLDLALRLLGAARRLGVERGPITLTIGANDLLRAEARPESREAALRGVAVNLRLVLARLEAVAGEPAQGAGPTVVVTGYYDPTGTPSTEPGSDGWWLARLDDTLEREARRAGAQWVDVAATFRGRERTLTKFPFDIHPSNAGHRAIAAAIWEALVGARSGTNDDLSAPFNALPPS